MSNTARFFSSTVSPRLAKKYRKCVGLEYGELYQGHPEAVTKWDAKDGRLPSCMSCGGYLNIGETHYRLSWRKKGTLWTNLRRAWVCRKCVEGDAT